MDDLIPFGKYKGQPLEVLASDKQYLEWLRNQDWFRTRYAEINTVIINNFQAPSETPEHNRLQARFTDDAFCIKVLFRIDPNLTYKRCDFEYKGIDVRIFYNCFTSQGDTILDAILIELKPTVSDDYPAILRAMHANGSRVLITEQYQGTGATVEQLRKIFASSGKSFYLLSEIV